MHNLLVDPIFEVEASPGDRMRMTLPAILAATCRNEELNFTGIRTHQKHAWNAFMVQLAYLALTREPTSSRPTHENEWASLIRALTPQFPDDEPWQLLVEDPTKPAFLQPPVSSPQQFKPFLSPEPPHKQNLTPDRMDILVTSKNLDLRMALAWDYDLELWAYSLVSLQTMSGYAGAGNYPISRMNSGYGNRPALSVTPSLTATVQMRRDLITLLEAYTNPQPGHNLLWTIPWDGTLQEQLQMEDLATMYIEVARRVRLVEREERIVALRASSAKARIAAEKQRGFTDDPWAPMDLKKEAVLTITENGIDYKKVSEILTSSSWRLPVLAYMNTEEMSNQEEMLLLVRSTARSSGKTFGHHEHAWPFRHPTLRAIAASPGTAEHDELGTISSRRIDVIAAVESQLRYAIRAYANRGDHPPRGAYTEIGRHYYRRLGQRINDHFFTHLQDEYEADPENRPNILQSWLADTILPIAREVIDQLDAETGTAMYPRGEVHYKALSIFEQRIRRHELLGPILQPDPEGQSESEQPTKRNEDQPRRPRKPTEADNAVSMAMTIAQPSFPPGDLAELRRMDTLAIEPPVYWELMAPRRLLGNQETEDRWKVILQCMALMTRPLDQPHGHAAHNGYRPVGAALRLGNRSHRIRPFYPEESLSRFIDTEGQRFFDELIALCTMLGRANVSWNWREMATLVLSEGRNPEQSTQSRRRIYRDYYRAKNASPPPEEAVQTVEATVHQGATP